MEFLSQLPKTLARSAKTIGRGLGSGKGKTAGRGAKGQKKRNSVPAAFEGGQLRLIKRLPYRRGIGNRSLQTTVTLKLSSLNRLEEGVTVTNEELVKAGVLPKKHLHSSVKVVASGKLTKKIDVTLKTSKKAANALGK